MVRACLKQNSMKTKSSPKDISNMKQLKPWRNGKQTNININYPVLSSYKILCSLKGGFKPFYILTKQESPFASLSLFTASVCFLGQVEDRKTKTNKKKKTKKVSFPNNVPLPNFDWLLRKWEQGLINRLSQKSSYWGAFQRRGTRGKGCQKEDLHG